MSSRDAILKRLRAGSSREAGNPPRVLTDEPLQEMPVEQKIALFREKMGSTRTEVYETSRKDWGQRLLALAAEKNAGNLLYAAEMALAADIERAWFAAGDESSAPELVRVDAISGNWKSEMFNRIDAAVTSCRAGIAATGSLVLWPDHREPRLMSLVPAVHFAVLDAEKLYTGFAHMLVTEQWVRTGMPTNALLISGPSKTADIESTLAYGVHGPKQLVVLLLR